MKRLTADRWIFWKDVEEMFPVLRGFVRDWTIDITDDLVNDPENGMGHIEIDLLEEEDGTVWFEGVWYRNDVSAIRVKGYITEDDFVFWENE